MIIFLFLSCSSKTSNKVNNDINFKDELNMDKFIIKLKAYSDQNPYPNIKD